MDESESKLTNVDDSEVLERVWSDDSLDKFSQGLKVYLNILKPRAKKGAHKINAEIETTQHILDKVAEANGDKPLVLEASSYKLLSDIMWKQWAILGQILKAKRQTSFVEGELEPEENHLEELRQLLELSFFQKIPRRRLIVSDLSEYYMNPSQESQTSSKITLTKDWLIGEEFDGDDGGFGKIYHAKGEDGLEAIAKFVPKAPSAERELLFVNLEGVRNVMPILDSGETDSAFVIIMPKADMSLRKFIEDNGPQSLEEARPILADILDSLQDLDGKIVHRDIKPENILLLDGKWCLADFGISRYVGSITLLM